MKILFTVITLLILFSGCSTYNQEAYNTKKATWEKTKMELKCVQQGAGYDPHFRHVEDTIPSSIRYTKWLCSDGQFHMSPYEYIDYLHNR